MKKILLFILIFLSISSISNAKPKGYYNLWLVDVEVSDGTEGEFYDERTKYGIDYSIYEDDIVNIKFLFNPTHISFTLNNKSNSRIKIIWDEAVYSGFDNSSVGVFHTGVKYNDREASQVPTSIMKGSKLDDIIIPKDKVDWSNQFSRWMHYYILMGDKNTTGKTIYILLPIEIDGEIVDYTFTFECTWENAKTKTRIANYMEYYREVIRN